MKKKLFLIVGIIIVLVIGIGIYLFTNSSNKGKGKEEQKIVEEKQETREEKIERLKSLIDEFLNEDAVELSVATSEKELKDNITKYKNGKYSELVDLVIVQEMKYGYYVFEDGTYYYGAYEAEQLRAIKLVEQAEKYLDSLTEKREIIESDIGKEYSKTYFANFGIEGIE